MVSVCSDAFADGASVTMSGAVSQTTAVLTSGLERIPDQLGYLVISEDGVLAVSVGLLAAHRTHPVRRAGIC